MKSLSEIADLQTLQSLIKGLRVCCMQRVYGNNVYLSEIAQIYQPQTISSTELTEDGFLVYGANGIIGKYKDYNHETEQICITCRGNTCGMVNYTKPMSWITGNAMVINTDKYQDKVCKRYLYHYLSAYNFNSIISGSGQPQIVRTPLEKLKITLPTISEQKQKAIIFDKIQDKIDINHKVLNLYIGQKQYLLRQMFI
ncbi:restriction endonuclease subunit S [Bacteroides thetaiotaomicron]|nr:restriction endonuclease subunit S [Bacteroides thetaiotaomicron]